MSKLNQDCEKEIEEMRHAHEREIKDQSERFQKFCEEIKEIYDEEKSSLSLKISQQKEKIDHL